MDKLEAMTREEQGDLPLSASMRGDNAYYDDFCAAIGHRPGYAVCLHKIAAHKAGRKGVNPDCTGAIEGGSCGALARRAEEEKAGKALFYISREVLLAHAKIEEAEHARIAAARAGVRIAPRRTDPVQPRTMPAAPAPRPAAKPSEPTTLVDFSSGLASAISAAAQESAAAPAPAPTPATAPVPAPTPKVGSISVKPEMLAGETPLQYARRCAALSV